MILSDSTTHSPTLDSTSAQQSHCNLTPTGGTSNTVKLTLFHHLCHLSFPAPSNPYPDPASTGEPRVRQEASVPLTSGCLQAGDPISALAPVAASLVQAVGVGILAF